MRYCSCFRSAVREKPAHFDNQEEKSSEPTFQLHKSRSKKVSEIEPRFRELLVRFGLLSHAPSFEKGGYYTLQQVSKMTEKELSFLKPLQRRKFQAAIAEAMEKSSSVGPLVSFDQCHVAAFMMEDRPTEDLMEDRLLSISGSDIEILMESDIHTPEEVHELVFDILKANSQDKGCVENVKKLIEMKERGNLKASWCLICAALGYCYRTGHGVLKDDMLSEQCWKKVDIIILGELAKVDRTEPDLRSENSEDDFSVTESVDESPTAPIEKGPTCAQYLLGVMDEDGLGVERDGTRHQRDRSGAARLYLKAAKVGQLPCAQHALAVCLFYGDGVPEDKVESVEWDKLAAEQGHAAAQYALGVCYDNGEGVKIDESKAFKYYKLAADQNYALAQFTLGQCFEYGSGTSEDIEQALKLYAAAAAQGNKDAKEAMKGLGDSLVLSPSTAAAVSLCRIIFDKPTCLITKEEVEMLLTLDSKGQQCPNSLVHLPDDKAEGGHALTMATAATCYYFGYGVEEDYSFAQKLWQLVDVDTLTVLCQKGEDRSPLSAAAKQYSAYLLGGMLIIGQGRVDEDEEEGANLLTRASAPCTQDGSYHFFGLAHAQFSIGSCHYFGVGVEDVDRELGVAYYKKAASQGHQDAIDELQRLKVPLPRLREGLPALVPVSTSPSSKTGDKMDMTSLLNHLKNLISHFEAMNQSNMELQAIEQWWFRSDERVAGKVNGKSVDMLVSKCSVEGLITETGRTYRLGIPHPAEPKKLQNAQELVHQCLHGKPSSAIPQELPELSARVQSLLASFKTRSPVSVLAVAHVEVSLSSSEILSVIKVQAVQRRRIAKRKISHEAALSKSALVIQSMERKRQGQCRAMRSQLLTCFAAGVSTGDFSKFIHTTEECSKIMRKSDLVNHARQLSTILSADAPVRWLGFTAPRSSKSGLSSMSHFCDSDDRSWKSLYYTPYVGSKSLSEKWLTEELPFGFLLGKHSQDYMKKFNITDPVTDSIMLDPHLSDCARYTKDLYTHPVDTHVPHSWRIHTGKGDFFLVLHLTGPRGVCSGPAGIELSMTNTETSLLNTVIDLNAQFDGTSNILQMRQAKVMAFRFTMKSEYPALVLKLSRHFDLSNPHAYEESCGYVAGFEVIMDTTNDSLWWANSDFYSQNSDAHVEDVDEHEIEMEKYRQAADRTLFEVRCYQRMIKDGTKEGSVKIRRKGNRLEARYKQKHLSYNHVTRVLSCYEVGKQKAEWERKVTGRASIDHDHPDVGFKVSTCNGETVSGTVLVTVNNSESRDGWVNAINTKDTGAVSGPLVISRRRSSSDIRINQHQSDSAIVGRIGSEGCQLREDENFASSQRRSRRSGPKSTIGRSPKLPLSPNQPRQSPQNRSGLSPRSTRRLSADSVTDSTTRQSPQNRSGLSPRSTRRLSADSVTDSTTKNKVHHSRLAPPTRKHASPPSPSRRKII